MLQSFGLKICGLVDLEDDDDDAVSVNLPEKQCVFINNLTNCVFNEKKKKIQQPQAFYKVTGCISTWQTLLFPLAEIVLYALQEIHRFGPEGLSALLKGTVAEVKERSLESVAVCCVMLSTLQLCDSSCSFTVEMITKTRLRPLNACVSAKLKN